MRRPRPLLRRAAGFTMLELVMAMTLFVLIGTVVVVLMRQGMSIFTTGTRDSSLQDRVETVLPEIEHHLQLLALPASFDPPPPGPTEAELLAGRKATPPPPVDVRVRSGTVTLSDVPEGPLRDVACPYVAWVEDLSWNRSDPVLRRAGDRFGTDQREITPREVERARTDTEFQASGGLREVCYIAVSEDETFPALLTLYMGWRSPVGGPGTLLDPQNLATLADIKAACRPVARGLLHFSITWRRVFATGWEPTSGRIGETEPYVGTVWDSTRALDRTFALFRSPESLGDPSDDVFPAWARLEAVFVAPGTLGLGRGDTLLSSGVGPDAPRIAVEDPIPLVGPGADLRMIKIDGEWLAYSAGKVDLQTGEVPVTRGARGTRAVSHEQDADVYVGLTSRRDVRLLFRDRYARGRGRGR